MERNVKARNLKAKKILSPSQRQDKPNAIAWVLKNYPQIKDTLVCKLIGTTKATIQSIREGTHKDSANIKPKNPVTIGLCNEADIEKALLASQPKPKAEKKVVKKKPAKKTASKKTTKKKEIKKKVVEKKVAKKTTKKAVKKTTDKKKVVKKTVKKTTKKTTSKKA